jgi:hypothetical protein
MGAGAGGGSGGAGTIPKGEEGKTVPYDGEASDSGGGGGGAGWIRINTLDSSGIVGLLSPDRLTQNTAVGLIKQADPVFAR